MVKCTLCEPSSSFLLKGKQNFIFLDCVDLFGKLQTSFKIAPYRHVSSLEELTEGEFSEHFDLFKKSINALSETGSNGFLTHTINLNKADYHLSTLAVDVDYSMIGTDSEKSKKSKEKCYFCEQEDKRIIYRNEDFSIYTWGKLGEEGDDYEDFMHLVLAPREHLQKIEECNLKYFRALIGCMQIKRKLFIEQKKEFLYRPSDFIFFGQDIRFHIGDLKCNKHIHAHIHNRKGFYIDESRKQREKSKREREKLEEVYRNLEEKM